MAMRDERARGGARRVDPHIGGLHVNAVGLGIDPVAEFAHRFDMGAQAGTGNRRAATRYTCPNPLELKRFA
ncbi:hypothetical protein GCM10011395_10820 [Sphingomonas psychrolutea]|uniref:Uncharacterized protein n=1 Tax=Sphingomonas psychrolutea TaxID=1259676 RepID=A0ABQ1GF84_9SPHN|nr:hypothetical protein GCM10011395_10820 [Sphingomonas psychrolutea]